MKGQKELVCLHDAMCIHVSPHHRKSIQNILLSRVHGLLSVHALLFIPIN